MNELPERYAHLSILLVCLVLCALIRWHYWRNEWIEIDNSTPIRCDVSYWITTTNDDGQPNFAATVVGATSGLDITACVPSRYWDYKAMSSTTLHFKIYAQRKNLP